jgi:fused signal recognition particle receptor
MALFWKRKKTDESERPSHWPPTILAPPVARPEAPAVEAPREATPDVDVPAIQPNTEPETLETAAPPPAPHVPAVPETYAVKPAGPPRKFSEPGPARPTVNFTFGGYIKKEPTPEELAELERTFVGRLKLAVDKTRTTLVDRIDDAVRGKKVIDDQLLDKIEEALIGADIGVQTALQIIETARQKVGRNELTNPEELRRLIREQLLGMLERPRSLKAGTVRSEADIDPNVKPYVVMIVGVNGVGKTTTIGKLASRIKADDNDVLICAADTFRAAANDQLAVWAERTGVPIIQQKPGTDPSAVLYDALTAAKARNSDVLIVDTAGRLHTKANLMKELEKMRRVAERQVPGAPHEVLLVIDAVTGQNGLEQARQFTKSAPVTGLVLTKLDGTAKGGIVVAIVNELGIPIRYIGIGERVDDLVAFDARQYIDSLFG